MNKLNHKTIQVYSWTAFQDDVPSLRGLQTIRNKLMAESSVRKLNNNANCIVPVLIAS